jgi:hypothetical protein
MYAFFRKSDGRFLGARAVGEDGYRWQIVTLPAYRRIQRNSIQRAFFDDRK